jgi:transcription antitermination factor NusG
VDCPEITKYDIPRANAMREGRIMETEQMCIGQQVLVLSGVFKGEKATVIRLTARQAKRSYAGSVYVRPVHRTGFGAWIRVTSLKEMSE